MVPIWLFDHQCRFPLFVFHPFPIDHLNKRTYIRHHADTRQTDRRDWDNLLSQQFTLKCKYISTRLRETDTGSQRQPGFTQSLGDKYAQIQPIYREDTEKCETSSLPKCKSEMELAYFSPSRDYERASKLVDQSSSG